MAAIAHPRSTMYRQTTPLPHVRSGARSAALAALAIVVGAAAISILMAVSILLAGPMPYSDAAPSSQPLPQPSAVQGLDL